ncbi:MAG: efflux RND transporter periplasmic adaptor subunit [Candidatus Eisenbacteria bacterium]
MPVGAIVAIVAALAVAGFFVLPRLTKSAPTVSVGLAEATGGGSASGDGITANGYVVARTKASVSSKILGRLAWIGVTEGSRVKAGDVIARIEDAEYAAAAANAQANVGQFEAQLAQAKRELKRSQSLRAENLVPESALEEAQTRVEVLAAQLSSARAQAKLADANLANTRVLAPFSGTVLRKDAEVGEIVAPSSAGGGLTRTAIVTMADLQTLEVEVDVNEAYIAQVRNGQDSRITLDAYPDTSFVGRVRQVVPTADRQKATVLVKVSILDRDPRILSEMGAKVVFLSRGADRAAAPRRVLAPAAAVVQEGGAAHVWVVENEAVRRVTVDVGGTRGTQVEIRQGLAGGESLVLQPPATLKDGARVKLANR